jgi:sulfite exporter TauE/SafE
LAQLDDIYVTSTYLIPWVTFLIALGGSVHCVGMCGGLVVAFTNNQKTRISYQIGRLLGYLFIGGSISLIGNIIRNYFQSTEVTLATATFMGVLLIFWGTKILLKQKTKIQPPEFLNKISKLLYKTVIKIKIKNEAVKTGFIGLLSIFLPCGFLYGVVFVIAAFNDPLLGMVSMLSFWLGTLPATALAPTIITKVLTPLKNKAPVLSSLSLISIGIITISFRYYQFYTTGSCH